ASCLEYFYAIHMDLLPQQPDRPADGFIEIEMGDELMGGRSRRFEELIFLLQVQGSGIELLLAGPKIVPHRDERLAEGIFGAQRLELCREIPGPDVPGEIGCGP